MKLSILCVVLSITAICVALYALGARQTNIKMDQATVYDRIMATKTLRCAYQLWPPFMAKDPNTGKMSGVYFDLFERMARDMGVKIEWGEEVSSAVLFEGLAARRYDMVCSPVSPSAERAQVGYFSRPIGYVPFYLYVRSDENRFDDHYAKANDPQVSLVALDGDLTAAVTQEEFPKANKVSLPSMASGAEILMNVADKKADGAVCASSVAEAFMKTNAGRLKQVKGPPLRYPSLSIVMPTGEERLLYTIDTMLTHYIEIGVIDKILTAHDLDETEILRVSLPYLNIQKRGQE